MATSRHSRNRRAPQSSRRAGVASTDGVSTGIRFAVLFVAFEMGVAVLNWLGALGPLRAATAWVASALVGASGVPVTCAGSEINLSTRVLVINTECTGAYILAAFAALVIAYPADRRSKLTGLVAGMPLLMLANLVRLVLVAHISEGWPHLFPFLHDFLFQATLVLVTVGVWIAWTRRVARHAA